MFADVINRNRIMYLLSILHFHDNVLEKNKVEQVEPLLTYFNERCKFIVKPEKNLSIDEQIIGYKGTTAHTSFWQVMPKKPTKRGFKVWTRCGITAFVYEMILHYGIAELDLVKDVPAGSSMFMDNYLASCKLIKTLAQPGYGVTCTVRSNRLQKCPISTEKQFGKKKRGYYEYFISNDNTCIVVGCKDSTRALLGSNHIGVQTEIKL
ncbi:unnamed protein product [Rotaria magnacalcarata]|uniref:PiggyBac transposable element-derived protein domain-containing protein n=1 Tax=Rotaria magnacalcarata TaxID=392030 RepID=A0A815RT64_9BILA|nr:unnamed protein product [Rotaria magnacalcarata]